MKARMTRTPVALVLFCCLANAQTAPTAPAPPTEVVIGGGLLGKLDGFCEVVSPSIPDKSGSCPGGRTPLGGLYALRQEVEKALKKGSYALLTGANLPKNFNANDWESDPFMKEFRSVGSDVTALGQDDFLRAVFPAKLGTEKTKPPSRFNSHVQAFLEKNEFRFLASNAAVRTNQSGLNTTWVKGYELMIAADQSIPWTTTRLTFAVPVNHPDIASWILEGDGEPRRKESADVRKGSATISVNIKPKASYTLKIEHGDQSIVFKFKVDEALTPWYCESPALNGLPVACISHPPAAPLQVVSLIDPAVLDVLDPSRWKDRDDGGAISLVLYPPADTAKFLMSRVKAPGVIPVLLSDLDDALAAQVASCSAAWRIVSFGGDSHMLGCDSGEAGCAKGRLSDYRSGAFAVLNNSRAWARPEWIAETLVEFTISTGAWGKIEGHWRYVPGGRFTSASTASRQKVQIQSKAFAPPPPLGQFQTPAPGTRIWWSNREDMAAVLMDAMRNSLHTDLAMADQRTIDPEVLSELTAMAYASPPLKVIGPRELLEILWRHDPYTVIKITGKDLVAALGKLAKLPPDEDSGGVCVRGLGGPQFQQPCSLPGAVKTVLLQINGRYLNSDEYYTVALPQSLARGAGLAYTRNHMVNVFHTVLDYLMTLDPNKIPAKDRESDTLNKLTQSPPSPGVQPAASAFLPTPDPPAPASVNNQPRPLNWPNLLDKKLQAFIFMPPAAVELAEQSFHVPNRNNQPDTSGFAAIPLVGEKAQHTFKLNLNGEFHVVPIDLQPVSLDVFTRVNLNRLETFPNTSAGFPQFAYTPDQWTNGAALRSKFVTDHWTRVMDAIGRRLLPKERRPALRFQPFIGYFDDTSVYHYAATYSRKADSAIFQESDAKPNYAYFGMGLEISPIAIGKYFSLNNTRLEQDFGMNYAAPKGVFISGRFYGMDAIRRCGVQNLLDGGVKGCDQAPTDGLREVRYQYATQRQSRRQFLTSLVLAFGPDNKKETFTLDIKATQWAEAPGGYTPLDPVRTAEFTFKSAFPVGAGIAFGPYFRYLTVNAFGSDGNFKSWRYGFMLNVPLTGKAGHGRFFF